MERLVDAMERQSLPGSGAIALLERIWDMHPTADPCEILTCAIEAQVRHLTQLPVAGGWLLTFLRTLPSHVPDGEWLGQERDPMIEDDVVSALAMRRRSHGTSGDAILEDARAIISVARSHMTASTVCRVAVRSYQRVKGQTHVDGETR